MTREHIVLWILCLPGWNVGTELALIRSHLSESFVQYWHSYKQVISMSYQVHITCLCPNFHISRWREGGKKAVKPVPAGRDCISTFVRGTILSLFKKSNIVSWGYDKPAVLIWGHHFLQKLLPVQKQSLVIILIRSYLSQIARRNKKCTPDKSSGLRRLR